ncbi:MAG: DAK2 domain-containing protein [Polyangiales bacterium]
MAAACAELESRRQEVNDLNVFPVADGDTGDNMAMTMRAVLAELDRINGHMIDEIGRDELVQAVARASLLGARGNSGVILSQIVRGAAEELASRPGELIDPILVSAALARAADAAYESVREPAEGTMLTAVRAMAHRVAQDLAHMEPQRLGPGVSPEHQDKLLARVLERALEAGDEAVRRGPDQLAVLREAGVVDAGAYGLTVIMVGVIAALRGDEGPRLEHHAPPTPSVHDGAHESSRYRYCTNFVAAGSSLETPRLVHALEEIGDSVLVVGDAWTVKVHVHTDHPDHAVSILEQAGSEVSRLDVADMRVQVADRAARLGGAQTDVPQALCAAVAVAGGDGVARLYRELGAYVVDGGPTLNPSTYDLLAGIHAAAAAEVIVLPNSSNVFLAAERAAELSEKPVAVVRTDAQQIGLAALLAHDPARSAAENAETVGAAAAALTSGGVARAAREDPSGRFNAGDAVGYVGEELVAWGEPLETLTRVLATVCEGCEVTTVLAGEDPPLEQAAVEAAVPAGVEVDFHVGGQPAWWWLVCAE